MTADEVRPPTARWHWVVLAMVVAGAFALRVYRLGEVPAGLFCDEAANGYNAYSLLHTGRDEHGKLFPLFIWSFFAFKYPLDIYPSMLWVGLFGLTEFATRFQAAIYGTGAVVLAFLIGRQLFTPIAGLAAAAALAVLPWHLHFSRIAFGLVGFTFWFSLGFYFLARALGDQATRRDWLLAAVGFSLCFYMYAVSQLLVPVFLAAAAALTAPTVWRHRSWAAQALLLAIVLSLPFVVFYAVHFERASIYVMQTSILAQPGALAEKMNVILRENWPTYFRARFLFESGDPILRHGVRNHGVLYWALLPWIAVGAAAALVAGRRPSKLLLVWLLLYPLGAAVTRETPSATRSILGSEIFAVLAGVGFDRIVAMLRRLPFAPLRAAAVATVTGAAVLTVGWQTKDYLKAYFVDYPTYAASGIEGFQYGYEELFRVMEERRRPGDRLVYSTTSVNNPYIFYLFYTKRPPRRRSEWGNAEIDYLGVRPTELRRWYTPSARILFAALPVDMWFFESWDDRVDIVDPGGKPAFIVLDNPRPKRFIDPWQLMAPFPNPNNRNRLAEEVDPATMVALEPTAVGEARWEPYSGAAGVVELNNYLGPRIPGAGRNPEFFTAYLRATLHSPSTHRAVLELVGSRDEMLVWLNGDSLTTRPLMLDESALRTVDLPLREGDNVLLVKTIETVGDWWFAAHLTLPEGEADRAVKVVTNWEEK